MDPEQEKSNPETVDNRQEIKREVIEFVKMIAWFLVLFFIVKTYVIEGFEVQGPSMFPTLKDRERILVLKLPHIVSHFPLLTSYDPLHAGDVIIFDSPVEANKRYVKRLIAKGPKMTGNTVKAQGMDSSGEKTTVQVDKGNIFVNKQRLPEPYLPQAQAPATDSAPELSLSPGDYYVLGDNRTVSKDSRSFGPIGDERIIGKALLCFWPPSSFRLIR